MHALAEHYEALRCEATATVGQAPRGHGLALFLARGMSVWMAAVRTLLSSGATAGEAANARARGQYPLSGVQGRAELTTVMAGLVLACVTEEEVGDGQPGQRESRSSTTAGLSVCAAIVAAPVAGAPREHGAPI